MRVFTTALPATSYGSWRGLFVVAHWPVNGAQRAMLGSFNRIATSYAYDDI